MSIILYTKKYTELLSEMLLRFDKDFPKYKGLKKTYAGRLDPLASGLIPVLVGESVHKKDFFLDKGKTYSVELLLGAGTDSGDILGLVESVPDKVGFFGDTDIIEVLHPLLGFYRQKYPFFSSKRVKGKTLFNWYKEGCIHQIDIPTKDIFVFSAKFLSNERISKKNLEQRIFETVSSVNGDFRQKQILISWKKFFQESKRLEFQLITLSFEVSSGTYVRDLVRRFAQILGVCASSLHITRTHIEGIDNSIY